MEIEKPENKVETVDINSLVNDSFTKITKDVDKGSLSERGQKLASLTEIYDLWMKTLSKMDAIIKQEKTKLEEEVTKEEEKLNLIKKALNPKHERPEKSVSSVKILQRDNSYANMVNKAKVTFAPEIPINPKLKTTRMAIVPGIEMNIIQISQPNDAKNHLGELCWCPMTHRFHFYCMGFVLTAMPTIIRGWNDQVKKFLEHNLCKNAPEKLKDINISTCDFYIPRKYVRDSPDVRQFSSKMK